MAQVRTTRRILFYEWSGFALVVLFLWLDELLDLPHLVLGSAPTPINWGELWIESLLVLLLAVLVTRLTSHLMHRVKHLEGLMHVCSSCRRVRDGEAWVSMEAYLQSHSQAELEATLCRQCLMKQFSGMVGEQPES